jgi:hypothetical protein
VSFANPAGGAEEGAGAYTAALLALLGDRDPIAVMEGLPAAIERATAGLDERTLRARQAPGTWSILEVVQHLADSEIVYGYRVRAILTEEEPALAGYDQDAWTRVLRYNEGSLAGAMAQLRALRAANLRLLRSLDAAALARAGHHAERGRESVELVTKLLAGHDLVHLAQIERVKRAVTAAQ